MLEFYDRYKSDINKTFIILLYFFTFYIFFKYIFGFISPFVFAFLVAMLLDPIVTFLTKKMKLKRGIAAFLTIFVVLTVIVLLGRSISYKLIAEGKALVLNAPIYLSRIINAFNRLKDKYFYLFAFFPKGADGSLDALAKTATDFTATLLKNSAAEGGKGLVSQLSGMFMSFFLFTLSTFFFLKDKELVEQTVKGITPKAVVKKFAIAKDGALHALVGYVKAQLTIMSVTAIIGIGGLLIMGNPYALVMGLLIAFVDALPIFGSGVILWPWILFSVVSGEVKSAVSLGIIYLAISLSRQLLEPKVLGTHLGIHPLITLMSIFIGAKLLGFAGFFIGPLSVVLAMTFFGEQKH